MPDAFFAYVRLRFLKCRCIVSSKKILILSLMHEVCWRYSINSFVIKSVNLYEHKLCYSGFYYSNKLEANCVYTLISYLLNGNITYAWMGILKDLLGKKKGIPVQCIPAQRESEEGSPTRVKCRQILPCIYFKILIRNIVCTRTLFAHESSIFCLKFPRNATTDSYVMSSAYSFQSLFYFFGPKLLCIEIFTLHMCIEYGCGTLCHVRGKQLRRSWTLG